jgi:hypothetical protein
MALNRLRKFRRIDDVQVFLNGGVVGGPVNRSGVAGGGGTPMPLGLVGLVGATLILSSPGSVTVTFVRSDGVGGSATPPGTNPDPFTLLFKDIKAQIEAAGPALLVTLDADQQIVISEAVPASGVTVSHTGTANGILGFDSNIDTVGKVYSPAVVSNSPPCWTWAYSGNDNMHNIYTWE